MAAAGTGAKRRRLRTFAVSVLAALIVLVFIEGASSTVLVGRLATYVLRPLSERAHTRHDPELGWVSVAGFSDPDMYGPGIGLAINEQGFRHPGRVADAIPADRVRIVCSGDEFTFGPGVGDDEPWCARLGRLDATFEAINMSQVGYGLDQIHLWFRRDGARLEQDVHLIAVTTAELERMRLESVLSYGKPTLSVSNGALVVGNTPVSARSALGTRLQSLGWLAAETRTAALIRAATGSRPAPAPAPAGPGDDPLAPVVGAVLDALVAHHRAQGSVAAIVFLPTRADYGGRAGDARRTMLRDAARDRLPFIDMVAELRSEPAANVGGYFLPASEDVPDLARGSYSAAGHEFIARNVLRRMRALPQLERQLAGGAR